MVARSTNISVDSNPEPIQPQWKESVEFLKSKAALHPTVLSGGVSPNTVEKWIETASKLHKPNFVNRLIIQNSGLGADDIRTLVAHERDEYYPTDSAKEIYDRKQLKAVSLPKQEQLSQERVLLNLVRHYISEKYSLERDVDIERKMGQPNPIKTEYMASKWLIGQPAMFAKNGDSNFIVDVHFTNKKDDVYKVEPQDSLKLHHYDLVATNIGASNDQLYLAKVYIEPTFAKSISALANLSKDTEFHLNSIAKHFDNVDKDFFDVNVQTITKNPEIYKEIIQTGNKHWSSILKGESPAIKKDPNASLSEDDKQSYIAQAKEVLASRAIYNSARDNFEKQKENFSILTNTLNINDNKTLPFVGVLTRKIEDFDIKSAATHLEQTHGVPPASLRQRVINAERMASDFEKVGGDISKYYEMGEHDKQQVVSIAEMLGADLDEFYTRKMTPLVSRQTRGPIFEAIDEINKNAELQTANLHAQLINDKGMDNPALYSNNSQQELKIDNTAESSNKSTRSPSL